MSKQKPKRKSKLTGKQSYSWQQSSVRRSVVRKVANRERQVMMSIAENKN